MRVGLLAVAFALPLVSFLCVAKFGTYPCDASIFRFVGRCVAEGGVPYVDAWDNKGPMLFLPQAVGYWLLPGWGSLGPEFVSLLISLATVALFHRLARRLEMSAWGAAAATCVFSFASWSLAHVFFANNQEAIAALFIVSGVLCGLGAATRLRLAGLGAMVGCAFLVKPNLVAFGGAFVIAWGIEAIRTREGRALARRLAWSFAGFVGVLGVVTGLFALKGAAYEMWDATLLFGLFEYAKSDVPYFTWWVQALRTHGMGTMWGANLYLWIAAVVGGVVGNIGGLTDCRIDRLTDCRVDGLPLSGQSVYQSVSQSVNQSIGQSVNQSVSQSISQSVNFLLVWLILEFLMLFSVTSFYPHYLIVSWVPLALGVGGLFESTERTWTVRGAKLAVVVALAMAAVMAVRFVRGDCLRMRTANEGKAELVAWIGRMIPKGARVAVEGSFEVIEILDAANLRVGTRYFNAEMNAKFAGEERRARIGREVEKARQEAKWLIAPKGRKVDAKWKSVKDGAGVEVYKLIP